MQSIRMSRMQLGIESLTTFRRDDLFRRLASFIESETDDENLIRAVQIVEAKDHQLLSRDKSRLVEVCVHKLEQAESLPVRDELQYVLRVLGAELPVPVN